ncbi:MAG: hypothetical protein AAB624_01900 [Patescibacteria group bacterium]
MYYDEEEYFEAVKAYELAEEEANKIKGEVFSFKRGEMPPRSITESDVAVMEKSHDAWDKVLEIARRPLRS